jgi:transcription elongation factor Elf1
VAEVEAMKRYVKCSGCKTKLYVEMKAQSEWRAAFCEKCNLLTEFREWQLQSDEALDSRS